MADSLHAHTWFVTGATGLVGSTIVHELRELDLNVIALVRESSPEFMLKYLESLDVKLVYGDLLDRDSYTNYLATCDVVVHTAAAVQVNNPEINNRINVDGTRELCTAMSEVGMDRLIHLSTAGVYGVVQEEPVTEEQKPRPYTAYRRSKYQAERIIVDGFPDISVTMLRPPFIYGDTRTDRHIYSTLVNSFPRHFVPKIWRYDPKFGFVHAEDIARLVLLAGSYHATPHQIYNIQGFEVSLTQIYQFLATAREQKTRIVNIPYFIVYPLALLTGMVQRLRGKPATATKRLQMAKGNWIFSSQRVQEDLNFVALHIDSTELEVLLSQYVTEQENTEPLNIQDLMSD